jgi:hypothetical protein
MLRSVIVGCSACAISIGCLARDDSAAVSTVFIERETRRQSVLLSELCGSTPPSLDTSFTLRNRSSVKRDVMILRTSCGCFQMLDGSGKRVSRGDVIILPVDGECSLRLSVKPPFGPTDATYAAVIQDISRDSSGSSGQQYTLAYRVAAYKNVDVSYVWGAAEGCRGIRGQSG